MIRGGGPTTATAGLFGRVAVVLVLLAVFPAGTLAQDRLLSVEFTPIHGTLGYGWSTGGGRHMGVDLGFGVPQLDRTLSPSDESLVDFFHLGLFLRSPPPASVGLDGRVQLGFASLDGCSGCLPDAFAALSGAAFWGGERMKVGARLTAGVIRKAGAPPRFVLNLTPLAGLFTHVW